MAKINREELSKPIRVALNFDKEILDIQGIRLKKGFSNPRDPTTNSVKRITEAIPRHPSWLLIKKDIIKSPLSKIN